MTAEHCPGCSGWQSLGAFSPGRACPGKAFSRSPDPLTKREREDMASHTCDLCGALLLIIEVGPHYRTEHPNDAPRVTKRERSIP